MKRFSNVCKLALTLLALSCASIMSAELQRLPQTPALPPTASEIADQEATANFLNFYNTLRNAGPTAPESTVNYPLGNIKQRPGKIMRSVYEPSQHLFVVVPNFNGMKSYDDAYYGQLDVESSSISRIYHNSILTNAEEAYVQTGVVRQGILYIPKMLTNMVTLEINIIWNRFDLNTGLPLSPINFGSNPNAFKMFCYSLTYDPVNDAIYGLTYDNNTGLGGGLIRIDCSKPEEEWVAESFYDDNNTAFNVGGTSADWMAGICYNPLTQTLYGLSSQGELSEIDTKNCKRITLRSFDYSDEDYCFPPVMQSTPMAYSPLDKAVFFISFNNNTGTSTIAGIDTVDESWDAYFLNDFADQLMASTLYCSDPFAEDNAPGIMQAPVLAFEPGKVDGTISVTAPTTYYNGLALEASDKMTLHVVANNKEIYSKEVAPGEKVSFQATLEQGLNDISCYCSLSDLKGAETSTRLYIGFDQPLPPSDLKYAAGVLTWKTPEAGVHGAYLDLSDVTYDVYVDGTKHNAAPVTGNSYNITFDQPADGRKYITVTATSQNVTSAPSDALSRVVGKGYPLPILITPTQAESTLFDNVNLNGGASEWAFQQFNGESYFLVHTQNYTDKPNDWLFLPPLYFDSAEAAYTMAVDYVNARHNAIQKDNLEVYIGRDPLPEAMTQMIYSHYERIQAEPTKLDIKFNVPEAGTYYIGFYSKPGDENLYRGIQLSNFSIGKSKSSTAVPGVATDVKLTAFPYGEQAVTVDAVFPTIDMAGNPLDPEKDLIMEVRSDDEAVQVTGRPGAKAHTEIGVNKDGFCDIYITVANDEGVGHKVYHSVYAGYDIPMSPENVKYLIDADNLGMMITWDPVGEVGEHGGYVDVDEVTYDFYTQSSTSATKLGTAGTDCKYHYTVAPSIQSRYYVGPVAVNTIGMSINGTFINETLGTPYQTPAKEDFGYTAFRLSKWLNDISEPYKGVSWGHCTEPDPEFADNIVFTNGGSLRATGVGKGMLRAPRITTKNDGRVAFKTRYWNYPGAGKIELWGKTYSNQEFRKVAELVPSRPQKAQWDEWYVTLPEDFASQEWIQLNVGVDLAPGQSVIIDTYEVAQNIDFDLQASSIDVPYSALIGETPKFNVIVTNAGGEAVNGKLTVELLGDGEVLDSYSTEIERLRQGENYEQLVSFYMAENYIDYDMLEVHAHAEAEGDENARNNDCYATFFHYDSTFPIVRDLTAVRSDDNAVNLNWSKPAASKNSLESAENYCPFFNTNQIGPWENVDVDGLEPFTINNKRWSGDANPSAWTVFNAEDMNTLDDERLSPRSGKQMLLARSIAYDTADSPTRAMDFLISPEVKGGSKVGFWINTLSSTYTETVAIWYSTTDKTLDPSEVVLTDRNNIPRKCGSFQWLKNFTKSGNELWEYCEVTLPEDAKYFAFVYSSFGMFGAMIDDISYEPLQPVTLEPDSYNVLVSYDNKTPETLVFDIENTAYSYSPADGREATYYVTGNYMDGDRNFNSPLSNPAKVAATGVNDLEAGQYVRAGKGVIVIGGADGVNCSLSDVNGKVLRNRLVSSNREVISVDPGIYLVTLGANTVKVIVR